MSSTDAHDVLTDIISKIQLLQDPEHRLACLYRVACCLASVVVAGTVLWRYRVVSSKLALLLNPDNASPATRRASRYYTRSKNTLRWFAVVIVLLQVWNIITTAAAEAILFCLRALKRNIRRLPSELFTFSVTQPSLVIKQQNKVFLGKDTKLFVIIIVSLVLYKMFLNASHHIIHLIVDIAKYRHIPLCDAESSSERIYDAADEEEGLELEMWESNKVVSFNENVTVVEYSPSVISSQIKPALSLNGGAAMKQWCRMFKVKKLLRQYIIPFILLVLVLPLFYKSPMILLTTSSTIYIHSTEYQIRYDHLYCAAILISIFNNFRSFKFTAPAFPSMTLLVTKFCWAYGYLTLVLSATSLPFFADILACWLKIMCNAITKDDTAATNPTSLVRVQVLTLSITQFLRHALLLNCYMVPDCAELELTPGSFLLIRDLLMRVWVLLNQCYLVAVPCVLWVLLIEWKLAAMA